MKMPWEPITVNEMLEANASFRKTPRTEDLAIPDCLKRDASNRAPFMVNAELTKQLRETLVNPDDAHLWFVTSP